MPVQTFAPMTKDFATFDCDAHITEPPKIWERAHAYLTTDELEALKATCWWEPATQQLLVNGKVGAGAGVQNIGGAPGVIRVTTVAGPGLKHDIQRALNVRNLNPKTALTQEQVAYLDHAGSYEPKPRLRDMDVQGIDQVMIIPTNIDTYPWLQNAVGARAFWNALEETGMVYGMHPFPAAGANKPPGYTEQYSGAELIQRTIRTSGLPHTFLGNMQAFMAEASTWVTMVLMSGFFERHPKLTAAVFESDSTWINFVLDECDKAFRLHRNDRRMAPLKQLPSETFFQHCFTGFEGDEAFPSRLPEYYGDIAAWSSDVYHHDGDDAWRAIETMQKCKLPVSLQAKMLGANARRLYKITPPTTIIRERICEIQRPDWWPTAAEITEALKPESTLVR